MNPILRNILAVILGLVLGSLVNGALIAVSGHVIPAPAGVDLTTEEGLKAGMHLFKPINFLFPFLAHALGTLVGSFITAKIAANRKLLFAMIIGLAFFIGGIMTIFMLPSPIWFSIVDATLAYFPMAYLGYLLAKK